MTKSHEVDRNLKLKISPGVDEMAEKRGKKTYQSTPHKKTV